MIPFKTQSIALGGVDLNDATHQISTIRSLASLSRSITQAGLINPPCLQRKEGGKYRIVSGFHRLRACLSLNWEQVPARVAADDVDELALIRVAIIENAHQRPLSLLEQARCVGLLADKFNNSHKKIASELSALGLAPWKGMMVKLLMIHGMPPVLKSALENEVVALPVALELSRWDPVDLSPLVGFFRVFPMGLNRQRESLNLIKEICLREKCTITSLCDELQFEYVDDRTNSDRRVQTRQVHQALFARRFPQRFKARIDFETKLKKVKLGPGVRLTPPMDFEAHDYRLEVGFKTKEELDTRLGNLLKACDHELMIELLP